MAITTAPDADRRTGRHRDPLVLAAPRRGFVWLLVIVLWSDAPFALTFDDAWYYGEIGRNLAHGHGSTFDTINGPTATTRCGRRSACSPASSASTAPRPCGPSWPSQLGCWIGAVGAGRPHGPSARSPVLPPPSSLLAGNPFVLRCVGSGLESGPGRPRRRPAADPAGDLSTCDDPDPTGRRRFGALLALAFLARTDAALLIVICAALGPARRPPPRRRRRSAARCSWSPRPAVTAGVYMLANLVAFGRPMQISGDIKRVDLDPGVASACSSSPRVAGVVGRRLPTASAAQRALRPPHRLPRRTGWYVPFCIGLVGYYTLLSAQQWLWYFAPLVLYGLGPAACTAAPTCSTARPPRARSSLRAVQAILLLPLLGGVPVPRPPVRRPRPPLDPGGQPGRRALDQRQPARGRRRRLAGTPARSGAFTDQPVVNLDGVVNSGEFADAMATGRGGALPPGRGRHPHRQPRRRRRRRRPPGPRAGRRALRRRHRAPPWTSSTPSRSSTPAPPPVAAPAAMAVFVFELPEDRSAG